MTSVCKKNLVVALMVLFGLSALANAAPAVKACPAQKCCCSSISQEMNHGVSNDVMDHSGLMGMVIPQACAPETQAPCCELKTDPPPNDLAVSTVSNLNHYQVSSYTASDTAIDDPQIQSGSKDRPDDGRLKIPLLPIYLQTQSILC